MAKKEVTAEQAEKAEEPQKHFLTILDETGHYKPPSTYEINRDAQGIQAGAKARRDGVVKRVTDLVRQELKRAV